MSDGKTQTKAELLEEITRDSLARGHIEFPKMLHGPNGRTQTVTNSKDEKSALQSGEWHPTPDDAAAHQAERDEADEKRLQTELNTKKRRQIEEENQKALDDAASKGGGHGPTSTTGAENNVANVAQRDAKK